MEQGLVTIIGNGKGWVIIIMRGAGQQPFAMTLATAAAALDNT